MSTRNARARRATWVAGVLTLAACSSSSGSGFGGSSSSSDTKDGGTSLSTGTDGGNTLIQAGLDASSVETSDDCPASAKLVYVTGQGSKLYSFYPPTFTFTEIGTLTCLDSPTHMTVDRQGSAWVVSDGSLYKASTADASCSAVTNWTPQPDNFADFALTFVGTSSSGPDNTLYMLGSAEGGLGSAVLGSFDLTSGAVTTIGMPNVESPGGDMTTNGDGNLYFLMDQQQLALYEINPSNADIVTTYAPGASGGGDQALAFYGGSFYLFENDVVYQFDPTTHKTTMLGMAPLQVTGAGESTCVPTVPPTAH